MCKLFGCVYILTGNNVKIDKFVFDYFEQINKISDMKKTEQIFDILMNCSYYSKNNILDKEMFTLYFTNEQLSLVKAKQKELGYENNLSRFVRYALFDFYMKEYNMTLPNKFFGELIDINKFKLLCDKCKDELISGEYTSYDLDLLRDNKKYEDKISISEFNKRLIDTPINCDFLEMDMLIFLNDNFNEGKLYSKMINLSTEQHLSNNFTEIDNEKDLEPFIDYDNIVPNIESFYYLFLYYAFVIDSGELDINEIFDETDEHIDLLLKKYSFSKIVKHFKEKYNMINTYDIFDKECVDTLLSNNVIMPNDIVEAEDVIELSNTIESDKTIESNKTIESDKSINT